MHMAQRDFPANETEFSVPKVAPHPFHRHWKYSGDFLQGTGPLSLAQKLSSYLVSVQDMVINTCVSFVQYYLLDSWDRRAHDPSVCL